MEYIQTSMRLRFNSEATVSQIPLSHQPMKMNHTARVTMDIPEPQVSLGQEINPVTV
jgi:hypothetical protein